MEQRVKNGKAAAFFKKNIYYIVIVACVLALGAIITVSAVANRRQQSSPAPGIADETPTEVPQTDTPAEQPEPGEQTQDESSTATDLETPDDPTPQPLQFSMPGTLCEVYFEYAMDQLVFHQTLGCWAVHKGCDFTIGGTGEVLAVADGVVKSIGSNILEGVVISVEHPDGYVSVYKSLADDPAVRVGQTVKRGDVLGIADDSAYNEISDGAHLHLEITRNGAYIDPMSVLPEELK